METTRKNVGPHTVELEFILTQADLRPHYERAILRAQQDLELPGFRKGRVPIPMIRQRFGKQIEQDAIPSIANDIFKAYVQSNNIHVIGSPELSNIDRDQTSLTLTITFDTVPEFELQDYKGLELKKPVKVVDDEEVDDFIDDMRLRAAQLEPAESVEDFLHVAKVKFTKLDDETGMPIVGLKAEEKDVYLDAAEVDEHLRDQLMDCKVGDIFNYTAPPSDEESVPERFLCTILDIHKVLPAALNDEFVAKYSGGRLETVEQLREDVRNYFIMRNDSEARRELENQIIDQLSDMHPIEVPHAYLHRVLDSMLQDIKQQNKHIPGIERLTAHDIEEQYGDVALKLARWELVRNKIVDAEGVQVDDRDFMEVVAALRAQGAPGTDAQLKDFVVKNEVLLQDVLIKKAFDAIIASANLVEIDAEAYNTLMYASPEEQAFASAIDALDTYIAEEAPESDDGGEVTIVDDAESNEAEGEDKA